MLTSVAQLAKLSVLTPVSSGIPGSIPDESMTRYFLDEGFTYYFFGPPPVGGGNFVSLIRKKLVEKNKEFICVDGVKEVKSWKIILRE